MKRLVWSVSLTLWIFTASAVADILVFTDGSRMEVESYQIKGGLVLVTTLKGQLRSVPRSYVDLEATERLNRRSATTSRAPKPSTQPKPTPREKPAAEEKPTPREKPVAPPKPPSQAKPASQAKAPSPPPSEQPAVSPARKAPAAQQAQPAPRAPAQQPPARPAVTPPAGKPVPQLAVPPPVWTDEELKVSVVIPSTAWRVETQSASFDVAVRLENREAGARATLALIRQRLRNYEDFQKVVGEVEQSLTSSPSYHGLSSGPLLPKPYTAHEFRYLKSTDGVSYFNRMVVYYSRDMAYVLSLSCPEGMQERNEVDFDALVRGLVIKKVRKDITPKGAPKS